MKIPFCFSINQNKVIISKRSFSYLSFISVITLLVMIFSSCNKDEIAENGTDLTVSEDQAKVEVYVNDAMNQADAAIKRAEQLLIKPGKAGAAADSGGCATITIVPFDTINFPKTITIDFGTVNCLCADGKYRRGQIISVITGWYRDSLSVKATTTSAYYVNDHKIEGLRTITNMGRITNGKLTFSLILQNGKVTKPGGLFATRNSNRTRVWLEGDSTLWPVIHDDVYEISGSSNGTNFNGTSYSLNITNPLRRELSCKWLVSGTVELSPGNLPIRTIDYGNGLCDNIATVTVNGITTTIYLP